MIAARTLGSFQGFRTEILRAFFQGSRSQLLVAGSNGARHQCAPRLLLIQVGLGPHHTGEVQLQVFREGRNCFQDCIKIHCYNSLSQGANQGVIVPGGVLSSAARQMTERNRGSCRSRS